MTNPPDRTTKWQAFINLADAHAEGVLTASRDNIVEDAAAVGMDLAANARSMRDMLARVETKVGKAAMAAAKEALRSRTTMTVPRMPDIGGRGAASNDVAALTLAARNGSEQSERDKATIQDDLDELEALQARRKPEP